MYIIVNWFTSYSDIWLTTTEQFDVATFKTETLAKVYAQENCAYNWKVVKI